MALNKRVQLFRDLAALQAWLDTSGASWDSSRLPYITDLALLDGATYRVAYLTDSNAAADAKAFTVPGLINVNVAASAPITITSNGTPDTSAIFPLGATSDTAVTGEAIGNNAGTFNAVLANAQVVPGTLVLNCSDFTVPGPAPLPQITTVLDYHVATAPTTSLKTVPDGVLVGAAELTAGTINYLTGDIAATFSSGSSAITADYSYNPCPASVNIPPACRLQWIEVEVLRKTEASPGSSAIDWALFEDSKGWTPLASGTNIAAVAQSATTKPADWRGADDIGAGAGARGAAAAGLGLLSVIQDPMVGSQGNRWAQLTVTGLASGDTLTAIVKVYFTAV
tara:strand:- start:734 stop:1750 length:1017 start_codon:yes stop_codon:yes gene_type:complete